MKSGVMYATTGAAVIPTVSPVFAGSYMRMCIPVADIHDVDVDNIDDVRYGVFELVVYRV
jgi:hypothetical protein